MIPPAISLLPFAPLSLSLPAPVPSTRLPPLPPPRPGLAIDYSSHLCHAYEHSHFAEPRARLEHSLRTMGLSILNAGMSTLLGVAFLGLSVTPIFHIIFLVLSHTVKAHWNTETWKH